MKCPKCNTEEDKVIDSRPWKDGAVVRRRRECLSCNYRFTTYEEIEREDLRAVKRDGRYEPFDRRKLVLGFQKACEKRPVSPELIEKTVDKVMEELEQKYGREIPHDCHWRENHGLPQKDGRCRLCPLRVRLSAIPRRPRFCQRSQKPRCPLKNQSPAPFPW